MDVMTIIGAFVLAVFATARLTRNLTFDDFPPTMKLREWWDGKTIGSGWNELFHCPYCMGIWVSLPITALAAGFLFGWAIFATIAGLFWVFLAWMTVGYIAGIVVATNWG